MSVPSADILSATLSSTLSCLSIVPLCCWFNLLRIKNLPRVHQPLGIQHLFDAAHHLHGLGPELFNQELFLSKADAVLTLV